MKKIISILLIIMISVSLVVLSSCGEEGSSNIIPPVLDDDPSSGGNDPVKLSTPVVSINDSGLASWTAIEGASRYIVKIDGSVKGTQTTTTYQLEENETIIVLAIGDGVNTLASNPSTSVQYTVVHPQKLDTPVVTVNSSGLASWSAIEGASGYNIKVDDKIKPFQTTTTYQLSKNESIVVIAVGNGTTTTNSDASTSVKYEVIDPVKLGTPVVTIGDTGIASWDAITNATGYIPSINGVAQSEQTTTSIQLQAGDKITVVATSTSNLYLTSDASTEVQYTVVQSYTLTYKEGASTIAVVKVNEGEDGPVRVGSSNADTVYIASDENSVKNITQDKTIAVSKDTYYKAASVGTTNKTQDAETRSQYNIQLTKVNSTSWGCVFYQQGSSIETTSAVKIAGNLAMYIAIDKQYRKFTLNVYLDGNLANTLTLDTTSATYGKRTVVLSNIPAGEHTFKIELASFEYTDESASTANPIGSYSGINGSCIYFCGHLPTKLATPDVSVDNDGLATWSEVANATGYIVSINGTEVGSQTTTSYQMTSGNKITVVATSTDTEYTNSDSSVEVQYIASTPGQSTYTVKYYDVDGTTVLGNQTVYEGNATTAIASPVVDKKTFVSWKTEDGVDFDFTTTITANINLYASYLVSKQQTIISNTTGIAAQKETLGFEYSGITTGKAWGIPFKQKDGYIQFSGVFKGQINIWLAINGTAIATSDFEVFIDGVSQGTVTKTGAHNTWFTLANFEEAGEHTIKFVLKDYTLVDGKSFDSHGSVSVSQFKGIILEKYIKPTE